MRRGQSGSRSRAGVWAILLGVWATSVAAQGLNELCGEPAATAGLGEAWQKLEQDELLQALALLEDGSDDDALLCLRGEVHYELGMYQEAARDLDAVVGEKVAEGRPGVRYALAVSLIASGQLDAAQSQVAVLREAPPDAAVAALDVFLKLALGRRKQALEACRDFETNPLVGTPSEELGRLSSSFCQDPNRRPYQLHLGTRYESDSNVALQPDDALRSGRSDTRLVGWVDLLFAKRLGSELEVFAEAHVSDGANEDQGELDVTRQLYSAGVGWSKSRWGLRLPVEWSLDQADGSTFLQTTAVSPGIFYRLGQNHTLYGFVRWEELSDKQEISRDDDRTGDGLTTGVLHYWRFADGDGRLRTIVQAGSDDADGANRGRDRARLFVNARYRVLPKLELGLGGEVRDLSYDNVDTRFDILREDDVARLFASLRFRLRSQLWMVALAALESRDSTIPASSSTETSSLSD